MKHGSLLALLPSGAKGATRAGPGAADLAVHILSHRRHDPVAGADAPLSTYEDVRVEQILADTYVFPLGATGDSLMLTGAQIAAGYLAERAADDWLEIARRDQAQTGDTAHPMPDADEADQLMDRAHEAAMRIFAPCMGAQVASLFQTHYRGGREFLRLAWEGLPEDLVPASRRPTANATSAASPDYDPYGLKGTSDYDVDKPLAYREKVGKFLFTMTYRHEYPQVDDERLGTAFAVFHDAETDVLAAAVELKLIKVPPIQSSADLVYVLDTYSGGMLSIALAATEALGPERLCSVFNTHRVVYVSTWEVRKSMRGAGIGASLLHEMLNRLPGDTDGRLDALCLAAEPYQTDSRYLEALPAVLRSELETPARRLLAYLSGWIGSATLPRIATHFFVPMAKHVGIGSEGENARLIDRIMESEA